MADDALTRTLESRIAEDLELAQTLVKRQRETIEPRRAASSGGIVALEALRRTSGTLDGKIDRLETIGEGGMGVVHLATQASLGRYVAVKTLRPGGAADVGATLRILREASVTGALEHPNIVPVYDVGVDAAGAPVIVMKRVEGRAWSEVMHDHAEVARLVGAEDALEANLRILVAVCNAMQFAHSRGILHRDIKPENVMIGGFGEVYLLDWGIAVSLRDDPSGRLPLAANAKEVAGTPSYMAPEMLLGDPTQLSERTDVYLLGAVFYELVAGEPPHEGPSLNAIISRILLSTPYFSRRFPSEARLVCEKAMHRDPAERYPSVEALRAAIEGYLQHRGSRKLAWDAKQSLSALLATLNDEPPSEERTLAVFNLLGECRFGYRAALSAWPGNVAARRGLDRALIGVIDHELSGGDPYAAATLLREVEGPPAELAARVEAAVRSRAEDDERLRRLEQDFDPTVGTRTRTLIGGVSGGGGGVRVVGPRHADEDAAQPPALVDVRAALRRADAAGHGGVARRAVAGAEPDVARAELGAHPGAARGVVGALVRVVRRDLRGVVPRGERAAGLAFSADGARQFVLHGGGGVRVAAAAGHRGGEQAAARAAKAGAADVPGGGAAPGGRRRGLAVGGAGWLDCLTRECEKEDGAVD